MRRDDEIVGLCYDALTRHPMPPCASGFDVTTKANGIADFRTKHFPVVTPAHPVVGYFHLPAILNLLGKHAVLVAQSVTERGQAEFGKGIEKTGRQATQAAIAQGRIVLQFQHIGQLQPADFQLPTNILFQTECGQRVTQRPAHQELHGQVVHPAHRALTDRIAVLGLGSGPALREHGMQGR